MDTRNTCMLYYTDVCLILSILSATPNILDKAIMTNCPYILMVENSLVIHKVFVVSQGINKDIHLLKCNHVASEGALQQIRLQII